MIISPTHYQTSKIAVSVIQHMTTFQVYVIISRHVDIVLV